jgi:hypothetical protein
MSNRPPEAVSDAQLERYLLGEQTAAERAAIGAALRSDPDLGARLEALERSNAEILERNPPRLMAAAIRARARARREPATIRRPAFALAAAVAVSVAALAVIRPLSRDGGRDGDVTRVKGLAPHLLLYRRNASGAEPLAPGSTARANDVVQIAYQAAGHRYGVIVSIDGRGRVTRHLPSAGPDAASLEPGAPVPLPEAFRLDDAPRFEQFYLVTAARPFRVDAVEAAVRRRAGDRLDLPASFTQSSFLLKKETAR